MNTRVNLSRPAQIYLNFALAVFVISAIICAGLFMNAFDFIDKVNSYILADKLADGMLRMSAAASLMTVLIDIASYRCE